MHDLSWTIARPDPVPDQQAIERGRVFESEVNETLGLRDVPGSGSQWHSRSDGQGRLRVSSKSESKRTWGRTRSQIAEAVELAQGTGETPALAIEDPDDGARFILFRLEDFAALFAEGWEITAKPSRADERRARAAVPAFLRDET